MDPLSFLYALGGVVLISCISLVGVFTLAVRGKILRRAVFVLVSISVGALFGDAFLHLLPEVIESGASSERAAIILFSGILAFFVLEKFLLWRHTHAEG